MKFKVFSTIALALITVCWVQAQSKRCRYGNRLMCGTNGITYKNKCEYELALYEDPDIEIQFEGSCMEYRKGRLLKEEKLKSHKHQIHSDNNRNKHQASCIMG